MRWRLALLPPLLVLAACTTTPVTPPVTPAASPSPVDQSASPATMAPTPAPSAVPNRPAHVGAPAIDDPYWLLYSGTSTSTVTNKDGEVIEADRGDDYQVAEGGSLEGTILIDGDWIGSLAVTLTEGQAIPGLDPIEQQFGAQIDDVLPSDEVLDHSPNPYWIRTTQQRHGLEVFVRVPADPSADVGLASEAFWWDSAHEKWYQLSVTTDGDFASVLTAILGPEQG